MNNTHINEVFNAFGPNQVQKERILAGISHSNGKVYKVRLLRKRALAMACSLIVILALFVGIPSILQQSGEPGMVFAFSGLTITAYASEINEGVITFDLEFLDRFDRVELSVSIGNISLANEPGDEPSPSILIQGNQTLVWHYSEKENAALSFKAFNAVGDVVSTGSLDISSGTIKMLYSFPENENGINLRQNIRH